MKTPTHLELIAHAKEINAGLSQVAGEEHIGSLPAKNQNLTPLMPHTDNPNNAAVMARRKAEAGNDPGVNQNNVKAVARATPKSEDKIPAAPLPVGWRARAAQTAAAAAQVDPNEVPADPVTPDAPPAADEPAKAPNGVVAPSWKP